MKKIFSVLICVILCVSCLASCTKAEAVPLSQVYSSLQNVTDMPAMTLMPDALIETLFGFELTDFEEYVFAEASDPSVNADTVILIKITPDADKDAVIGNLESYLQSVRDNTQSYSPENFAKTKSSNVCVAGNYIYLIITSGYSEAVQIVEDAVNG